VKLCKFNRLVHSLHRPLRMRISIKPGGNARELINNTR